MSIITKTTLPTLAVRLAKVHVLLVDDDNEILNLLRGILIKLGFEHITACRDGAEAIQILKQKRLDLEVDMMIVDWNMQPVNGIDLIKYIRTSPDSPNQYLPIIMLTGRGEWQDVSVARDAGFSEFLVKPFTAKALCDRIILSVENPREFVSSVSYKGPSRRRRDSPLPPGITQERRKRDAVNTLPGKALKSKIGHDINTRQIFTPQNINGAQDFIDNYASEFQRWVHKDIAELMHVYRNAKQVPDPSKYYGKIKAIAFSIKSHAGTFGYDLASMVARSLYNSCEKPLADNTNQLIVLEKHIETLNIIFHNDVKGEGDGIASELLEGLESLIRKYRKTA